VIPIDSFSVTCPYQTVTPRVFFSFFVPLEVLVYQDRQFNQEVHPNTRPTGSNKRARHYLSQCKKCNPESKSSRHRRAEDFKLLAAPESTTHRLGYILKLHDDTSQSYILARYALLTPLIKRIYNYFDVLLVSPVMHCPGAKRLRRGCEAGDACRGPSPRKKSGTKRNC